MWQDEQSVNEPSLTEKRKRCASVMPKAPDAQMLGRRVSWGVRRPAPEGSSPGGVSRQVNGPTPAPDCRSAAG